MPGLFGLSLNREAEGSLEGRLEASKSIFSRNRAEPAESPVVIRDGSLRQRGGAAAPVEIEESLLQPDQDAPVRGDSMSLFATLVPPPLRKSKKNFSSGKQIGPYQQRSCSCKLETSRRVEQTTNFQGVSEIVLPCWTLPKYGHNCIIPGRPIREPMTIQSTIK